MGIEHLVQTGPLILAAPIAAAAGALTFLSPCVLPLVPGYLSYVTGMSGTDAERAEAAARLAPMRVRRRHLVLVRVADRAALLGREGGAPVRHRGDEHAVGADAGWREDQA